jgi:hypothetical protein
VLSRNSIFRPLSVLTFALAGASLYLLSAALRFSGQKLSNEYLYVVPVVIPFVAFLFDRAERFQQTSAAQSMVDVLVVGTAMWRAIGHVPLISGHALFLTYSLLTVRTRVAQITALAIILQVIYLKLFVWHDLVTPLGGIVLGSCAALLVRRLTGGRDGSEARAAEMKSLES